MQYEYTTRLSLIYGYVPGVDAPEKNPGSVEAIADGCTCSAMLNGFGEGYLLGDGNAIFWKDKACPLHGLPTGE